MEIIFLLLFCIVNKLFSCLLLRSSSFYYLMIGFQGNEKGRREKFAHFIRKPSLLPFG